MNAPCPVCQEDLELLDYQTGELECGHFAAEVEEPDYGTPHGYEHEPTPTWASCLCGQIYSGHEADVRLAKHLKSPDPNGIGALLIGLLSKPVN